MTKMIYLASPYTHKDKWVMEHRERDINLIGAKLCHIHKVAIFAPITTSAIYSRLLPDKFSHTFDTWKDIDLCAIDHSDEVWVVTLKGWTISIGVQAEITYAKDHGIPVKFIDPETLEFTE